MIEAKLRKIILSVLESVQYDPATNKFFLPTQSEDPDFGAEVAKELTRIMQPVVDKAYWDGVHGE